MKIPLTSASTADDTGYIDGTGFNQADSCYVMINGAARSSVWGYSPKEFCDNILDFFIKIL